MHITMVASFLNTTFNAYGYNDGDWLHRANANADGIMVRVIDVSGVKKLYAFISTYANALYFVPASLLRSTSYTNDYFTTGFGIPSTFVTNIFEETPPANYVVAVSDRRVSTIATVAVSGDNVNIGALSSQIPTVGYMRVPTTTGISLYNGYATSATSLEGKSPIALAGQVPTNTIKLANDATPDPTTTNWWTKLPAYLRTTIIISLVVALVLIILKFIKVKK